MMMRLVLCWLACVGCLASAATLTVENVGDSGEGSLRWVIAEAQAGDRIHFSGEVLGKTITLTSAELVIDKDLSIMAGGENHRVTIDADGDTKRKRVLRIAPGANVTLYGLVLTGGRAPDRRESTEQFVQGESGGGIFNEGTLKLIQCTVTGNQSGNGINNNFTRGGNGAGIYTRNGSLHLDNCQIIRNQSGVGNPDGVGEGGSGVGIYQEGMDSSLVVVNSLIAENITPRGGGSGIAVYASGSIRMINTTVTRNALEQRENSRNQIGHILVGGGRNVELIHCTIVGNNCEGPAVGLGPADHVLLENNIIARNGTTQGDTAVYGPQGELESPTTQGVNWIGSNHGVEEVFPAGAPNANGDWVGTRSDPLDPRLAGLSRGDAPFAVMRPLPDSPVRDLGTFSNKVPNGRDATGHSRMSDDGKVDLGAVEFRE